MSRRTRLQPSGRPGIGLAGLALFPLAVLFLLFFFDEFDTAAFNVLAPNIEHAFKLSDRDFGLLVIVNVSLVLLLAVPVSHYGDRLPRTKLVVVGGIIAGFFSFFTGLAYTIGLLVAVRLGNGVGRLVNDPVHTSLLSDYYPPDSRAGVFAAHRSAVYLGAVVGPALAGTVSALFGWRAAFMVLIVPIVIVALVATRLHEPRRGATDDPDAASVIYAEAEPPVPFREAARTLWSVRTLKRQYAAWIFIGAGIIPLAYLLPLYLKRVYGLGDFPRGLIGSANAAATFAGVIVAGRWTTAWLARSPGEPLRRAGYALVGVGVGLLLVAVAPWLPLALVIGLATSFVAGFFTPPFVTVQAMVSPARVRTLSFGFGSMFLVAGVWGLFLLPGIASISDDHGLRWGLGTLMPYWVIGGLVLASAGRFVGDDTDRALRSMAGELALRRQRQAAGERSLLLCTAVDVAYEQVQVLFGVDLDVREGEIVALLGTNGAGKSTLLKAISGLVDPIGGAIFFDSRDVTHLDAKHSAELGIIQMPGGRSIFPTLTVNESLRLAGWMYKKQDPGHVRRAAAEVLDAFPVLRERADTLAGNLSGGEQQMLGLGMALIAKPRLLMIDELSLGLAPAVVGRLVDIVRRVHEQGTTIILVEQSVNIALTLAQRAVFMEKGEVRFVGPTSELLARGDILRSVFLEGAASAGHAGNGDEARRPRRLPAQSRRSRRDALAGAPLMLELFEVTKRFGGIRAVDRVSLDLRQGEILGVIGPNGAGKTTLFDLVSGFLIPDSGQIGLAGRLITDWSPDRRSWAGLGRSFQDARLFPSLTVAENIAVALERHLEVRDPLACALGLPAVAQSEVQVAWSVHELIELMGLGAFRNKFVSELSTGSRRIVDLAMTIAHEPSVLILDEPSSGIAQRETEALGPLLQRIQAETDCSLLVIEHDMPLVTSIADRLVALELGAVVTVGAPKDVVAHPDVVASYLGADPSVIARSGSAAALAGPRAERPARRRAGRR